MTELQIRKRNKIEKWNCKHEMKRTFPVVLCGMFAFDNFLLEHKMGAIAIVLIVLIVCQSSEPD
jgi:hypothetical protein